MDELESAPAEDTGMPAWVMTFADLMSLLMCFFVLMLAFSEMDAAKFKQLAGSMKEAFGVQADIKAKVIPKGTSLITKEFTPGKPQPTPLRSVRQFTTQSNRNTLKWIDESDPDVKKVKTTLAEEINQEAVSVEVLNGRIVIHVREKALFPSGSADLKTAVRPVLEKVRGLLTDIRGQITIAGHTDDVPIATARFRSNWELSAARAVSVAHELLQGTALPPERFAVTGHAETMPLAPNDTPEGRAQNRRVTISIERTISDDPEADAVKDAQMRAAAEPTPAG